jgi:hypothetical protein
MISSISNSTACDVPLRKKGLIASEKMKRKNSVFV